MPENYSRPMTMKPTQTQAETARNLKARAREAHAHPRDMYGVAPFGLPSLDKITGGMGEDWNVLIASRPGWGKSALAVSFAENMARYYRDNGIEKWVKIASYEMSPEAYLSRVACGKSGVSDMELKRGTVNDLDLQRYFRVLDDLAELPIEYTKARSTFNEFAHFVLDEEHPCGVWVLDHVGLLSDVSRNATNTTGALKVVANSIQRLCQHYKKPGLVVCHMNRKSLENEGGRARLDNLGGADELGKNADLALSIYRPNLALKLPEDLANEPEYCFIDIIKNRHGPSMSVPVYWYPERTLFLETGRQEQDKKKDEQPKRRKTA
jgi:replicative DNA helicase